MSFNPLALVVVMNLRKDEIKDNDLLGGIEEIIASSLASFVSGGINREKEMFFHFSFDPSITSAEIPVAFRITLLPSDRFSNNIEREKMAEIINRLIKAVLSDRPNILVLVESLIRHQAAAAIVA